MSSHYGLWFGRGKRKAHIDAAGVTKVTFTECPNRHTMVLSSGGNMGIFIATMAVLSGASAALFTLWAIRTAGKFAQRNQFWGRVDQAIEADTSALTPDQIAEFHAQRWDGD